MPHFVRTRSLTAHEFSGFGTVLERPKGARQDFAAEPINTRLAARANVALLRVESVQLPFVFSTLERHNYSTQTFFPLDLDRYLVVVCRAKQEGKPDLDSLYAFECSPGQAVQYDVGTWHTAIRGIGRDAVFAMLIYEDGTTSDCETCDVPPFRVQLTA